MIIIGAMECVGTIAFAVVGVIVIICLFAAKFHWKLPKIMFKGE